MYRVLLAFDNYELMNEIRELKIWGQSSEFEIVKTVRDGRSAYNEMKSEHYDLVITEIYLSGMDALQLLRASKSEDLCDHIALCSETANFDYARHGIILGAFDYFVRPFDVNQFCSMFSRIKNEDFTTNASEVLYADELVGFFERKDSGIDEYITEITDKIYSSDIGTLTADRTLQQIYKSVIDEVFNSNEWLNLYFSQNDFYLPDNIHEGDDNSYKKHYHNKIVVLFDEYIDLYPNTNDEKIEQVLLYILFNPESDLRQKTIADNLYINSSYLSVVFSANTNMRFVDFITKVKMKRAGWLLRNTDLKIADIAVRLYYKDMGYFLRIFKKYFGITPSEYRHPESFDYSI